MSPLLGGKSPPEGEGIYNKTLIPQIIFKFQHKELYSQKFNTINTKIQIESKSHLLKLIDFKSTKKVIEYFDKYQLNSSK